MPEDLIHPRLQALQSERAALSARARLAQAKAEVLYLAPGEAGKLRECAERLGAAMASGDASPRMENLRRAFRSALDFVIVYPSMEKAGPIEIETGIGIIGGAGGSGHSDNGDSEKPESPLSQKAGVLSFGRFMAA